MIEKYNIFPLIKPNHKDLIWFLNSQLKEELGFFDYIYNGFPIIIKNNGSLNNYHFKFWRTANKEDHLLITKKPKFKSI